MITLVIIGVIAAITVPTLITKYQKEQTVTKLKKEYSVFNQAVQLAIKDYGTMETWDAPAESSFETSSYMFQKYVIPYLSISKPIKSITEDNIEVKKINNDILNFNDTYLKFYLTDGTSVIGRYNYYGPTTHRSLAIYIDINGDKQPNRLGRDIFIYMYWIYYPADKKIQGRFLPNMFNFAQTREQIHQNCSFQTNGDGCANLIMTDSWQIKDDYPW
ncbi:hypothetical protein IKQ26_06100 [bacterium]|nr:hypothetical protein [bacterium]